MPAEGKTIKVLIVDDQRTFGEALQLALAKEKDLRVVDVVTDGPAAVEAATEFKPDVVLMDAAMPGMSGIEATRRIKDADPDAQVLILSGYEDELLLARAVQAGAVGLLRKTEAVTNVADSVRLAHRGEPLHDEKEIEGALRRLRHRRERDATVEKLVGLAAQLDVRQRLHRGLERVDRLDHRTHPLDVALVLGAEDRPEDRGEHGVGSYLSTRLAPVRS